MVLVSVDGDGGIGKARRMQQKGRKRCTCRRKPCAEARHMRKRRCDVGLARGKGGKGH